MAAPYADSPGRWQFLTSQGGKAELSWTPTPDMANPFGSVHGGIIATVIDEACGAALMPLIETPSTPTVSLNVEYLHPVPIGGNYSVRGEIVRKGRAMAIADARIVNEEGMTLVRGTCFFQVPRPKEATPPHTPPSPPPPTQAPRTGSAPLAPPHHP